MNVIHKTFLEVLKSALLGKKADFERELQPEQWQELFSLAQIHHVLPMVYNAVYDAASLQSIPLAMAVKRQTRQQVMVQTQKTSDFLALNRKLCDAGIRPLVVKGIICRNLYPNPDCRVSGDEDILVPAEAFGAAHRVMQAYGMSTTAGEDLPGAYEVPYRKEGSPLYIELHKHLFPPESAAYGDLNRFFEGVHESAVSEEIQGNAVYTMDYTDHLFYLICHAFKHFLHSGFGIRQVCDIILFANRYGARIDWQKVLRNCEEIRADKFAAAMFCIGRKYLTFDPEQAGYPAAWRIIKVNEMPMLEDLLIGGVYGDANMSRKHSSNITLAAVVSDKQGRRPGNAAVSSLFPPAEKLERRYPYLAKRPYLVPVAWCDRLWKYARETRHSRENSASDALKIGNERIALMKEYGILK